MTWLNKHYREEADLLGVVRGLMACNAALYEPIDDAEILHYIEVARGFRDAFREEKGQQGGNRGDGVCADAVRLRLQLPQSDYGKFYPGSHCDYLTPERVFLLACVAVTGSRAGARMLCEIALPDRTPKGLRDHINLYLKGTLVPNE